MQNQKNQSYRLINGVWKAIRTDKDPADRLIVATARAYDCPLVTADREILAYPHVKLIRP